MAAATVAVTSRIKIGSWFAVQVLIGLGLIVIALSGGLQAENFQRVLSIFAPGAVFDQSGLTAPLSPSSGLASLTPLEIAIVLPAPLAGVVTGVYLAFGPRYRPA